MPMDTKGDERSGLVLTAGVVLSTVGVVLVALVCCGVPVLLVAAGVFGVAGSVIGHPWMIAVGGIVAAGLLLWMLRRRSSAGSAMTGGDCCASAGPDQGPPVRSDISPATSETRAGA